MITLYTFGCKTDVHSIGQYAALVTARVLSFVDALRIVACRARLMIEKCPLSATGMLAVNRSASEIQQYILTHQTYRDLSIACCNSPRDCVVGGALGTLEALRDDLKANLKYKATMLANPMAYHTDAMNDILPDLTTVASLVKWSAPQIPVICNVLGRVVAKDETCFTADFPARHCRQSVQFDQGIKDALSHHLKQDLEQVLWIEIGPHPSIIPMVKSQTSSRNHSFIASMRKSTDPWITLSEAQSQIYLSNMPVQWVDTFSTSQMSQCITLPSYQFDYTDFLVEYPSETAKDATAQRSLSTGYELLDHQLQISSSSTSNETVFESPIAKLAKYITGHIVCGFALCPASVYHEIALAAAEMSEKSLDNDASCKQALMLSKIAYIHPLLYAEGISRTVRVTISPGGKQDDIKSFAISSHDPSKSKEVTHHCRGFVKRQSRVTEESKLTILRAQLQRPISLMESMESVEVFKTRAIYEKLFPRVVTYSKMYQAVQSISISPDGTEALAIIAIPTAEITSNGKFAVNPVFMDVILHVAGFVANFAAENDDAFICKELKSAKVIMDESDLLQPMKIYCSNTDVDDGTVGNGYALGSNGQLLAVFKGMHFARVRLRAVEASFKTASGGHLPHSNNTRTAQSRKVNGEDQVTADSRQDAINADVPSIKSAAAVDAKSIIADVCGAVGTALSSESELDGLGIDSLMILELGSRIQETIKAEITSEELNACVTVRDVETLVFSKNKQALPSLDEKASSRPITGDSHQESATPNANPEAASIIADICGADADKISAETTLESLGIDSLMMFELEDKFREINAVALEGNTLASCKTLGDIESLIKNEEIPSNEDAPQRKQDSVRPPLKEMTSSSSEDSQLFSDSTQLSTPATRTSSTSPLPDLGPTKAPRDSIKLPTSQEPLSLIQPGRRETDAQPLILIHDGSGLNLPYRKIHNLIRPLWGISNPKAFTRDTWPNLDAMAKAYAANITARIKGPVILGGSSTLPKL